MRLVAPMIHPIFNEEQPAGARFVFDANAFLSESPQE